jgi:hypothetical protein
MVSEKKKIFEISANLKGHGNHIEFSNGKGVRVMVLYATFKNISIISLQSVLIERLFLCEDCKFKFLHE